MDTDNLPAMYTDLAEWWPVLSAPEDYAEEASVYVEAIHGACPEARTVLELGSGGGNNASHMKAHFALTLVDRSPRMLTVSRRKNPECEHVEGDMRTVRLGRTFDAVFVHDAVMYMATEDDLARAIRTAFVHCRPGGAALFVPDCVRETFQPSTRHGGHDGPERSLRYLEWESLPDPEGTSFVTDFAFLLREADSTVRIAQDRHVMGLFPRATWLRLLCESGFDARCILYTLSDAEGEMFLATRPAL